jgi:hypothetical protein
MLDKREHFAASHFTARKAASVFEDSNGGTERFFFICAAAPIAHHFRSASHAEFHQGYGGRTGDDRRDKARSTRTARDRERDATLDC